MRTLTLLLPCLLALPLTAQKAKPATKASEPAAETKVDWDGEWSLHVSQSDKIDDQIDAHLKDLNFALKLFWKKKLQGACRSFSKLDILAGDSFSVTMGKERPIDTPTDGTEAEWKRSDDTVFKATLTKNGPTMIQTLTGDGYTLKHVYSMRKDGNSLALQVTYTHPKLDNPFSYKLVFKRND
ncbi:hypothetical protein GETHLI_08810 [Geothrix limicola]|uniref:DUF1579 domain-containing protein n=1 Tax=Geothrix limicola TaxID=2927978 RepID=A0ABQ5QCU3_9BACT|nr:hypothetical protein [Geothrix limicola]GLH72379.1 hypothetical protein GETHLI_08810 [Geothrix limicola]